MTKAEIIDILVAKGKSKDYLETLNKSKLEELHRIDQDAEALLTAKSDEDVPEGTASPVPSGTPVQGDKGWTEYLISQLYEDETQKGFPTTDGLRRLFEKYKGRIVESIARVVEPANINNLNRATVEFTVKWVDDNGNGFIATDVADCSTENSMAPYNAYPSATAATMAEGRVYRKKLGLKTLVSEEAQKPNGDELVTLTVTNPAEVSKIQDPQANAINKRCTDLGINLDKFIAAVCGLPKVGDKKLEELSYAEAQAAMKQLNNYNRGPTNGGDKIPDSLFDK